MKLVIVSPMYYLGKEVANKIDGFGGEVVIVLTDDVSPIFPLEARMEWISRSFYRKNIVFDSLVQNDESEEFLEAVKTKVASLGAGNEVMYFLTDEAHENLKELPANEVFKFKSPLEVEDEELDDMFLARFGTEFSAFTKPKNKELPTSEVAHIIPYFQDGEKTYLGFVSVYNPRGLETCSFEIPYKATVAEHNKYLAKYTEAYFGEKLISKELIGWLDENYWKVKIEKPSYIDYELEDGLRKHLALDADIVFIDKDYLEQINSPLIHWIKNKFETEENEKDE